MTGNFIYVCKKNRVQSPGIHKDREAMIISTILFFKLFFIFIFLIFIYFYFLFLFLFYFLFFWLCWVFIAARGLSLAAASGGHSSLRCTGFSLRWPLLSWSTGSRVYGLQ